MQIKTIVPNVVVEQLNQGETVNGITDYDNPYSKRAYCELAKIAQMDNYFFGLVDDDNYQEKYVRMSNPNNSKIITMDIPEDELFVHNYFDFSALIYLCDCCDEEEGSEKNIQNCINAISNPSLLRKTDTLQVIYQSIKPEYVLSIS